MNCTINNVDCCGEIDLDHVKTKGSGGGDTILYGGIELNNLMPLCRWHHIEKGQISYSGMIRRYPKYLRWLLDNDRDDIIERSRRT